MKKLLIVMVVALLALALVACGGEEATTTKGDDAVTTPAVTTPKATEPTTTTPKAPVTTTVAPETTKAPETTPAVTTPAVTTPAVTTPEVTTSAAPKFEYTVPEDVIDMNAVEGLIYMYAIEDHHDALDRHPAFVVCLDAADGGSYYQDVRGEVPADADNWSNPKYTWVIKVNGEEIIPAKASIYDGETWGYFRLDLGPNEKYDGVFNFAIEVYIVDNETKKAVYYGDFGSINYGFILDEDKPEGVTAIAPEKITVEAGPDMGGDEGVEKAFDGKFNTKVCTGDNDTAIVVKLDAATTLKGIGLCNANDNESSNGRTVLAFEVYVSADGTTWGDAVYTATGEGLDKADYSTNFMEMFYGFETPVEATYVKVVIDNGEMYQLSEIFLYA